MKSSHMCLHIAPYLLVHEKICTPNWKVYFFSKGAWDAYMSCEIIHL